MIFKCKPVWQFQSVEFDFDVKDATIDLPEMFEIYKKVLKGLMDFAPEQTKNQTVSKEPLATPGQKATMDKFGIVYDSTTTKKQAQSLIQASIDGIGD